VNGDDVKAIFTAYQQGDLGPLAGRGRAEHHLDRARQRTTGRRLPRPRANPRPVRDGTVFAICVNPVPGYEIVSHTTDWSSSAMQETTVECRDGKYVLGTGANIQSAHTTGRHQQGLQVALTVSPGHITRAQAHERPSGFGDQWRLRAFAVCANRPQGYTIRNAVGNQTANVKSAMAECPVITIGTFPFQTHRRADLLGPGGSVTSIASGHVTLDMIGRPVVDPGSSESLARAVESPESGENWVVLSRAICALTF
jgi:hypothetical protein